MSAAAAAAAAAEEEDDRVTPLPRTGSMYDHVETLSAHNLDAHTTGAGGGGRGTAAAGGTRRGRRFSAIDLHPEDHPDNEEMMRRRRSVRVLRQFAHDDHEAGWLYKSFHHPVKGRENYRKGELAAIKIQAIFRGRRGRNKFLAMYENKNALFYMMVYLKFYIFMIMYMVFKKTSLDGFMMADLLRDYILDEEFLSDDTHIYKSFHDVASEEEFWQYLQGPFAANMFPEDCYAHPNYTFTDPCAGTVFTNDLMVGGLRMSQYRVAPMEQEQCFAPEGMSDRLNRIGCHRTWYSSQPSENSDFLRKVDPVLTGTPAEEAETRTAEQIAAVVANDVEACFQPKPDSITRHFFSGQTGYKMFWWGSIASETYDPDNAYVCEILYADGATFVDKLKALQDARWIDPSTRAVSIEFSFINPTVQMSTAVRLFFEFPASGGVITQYNFSTAWLFAMYKLPQQILYWCLWLGLLFFSVGYFVEEIGEAWEQGFLSYLKDLTNFVDIFNYMLVIFVLVIDQIASQLENVALAEMQNTRESDGAPLYVDLVAINYISDVGNWAQAFNLVALTLKLFKYFRVSPQLNIMLLTISKAGNTLAFFGLIMFVTVMGFALAFYCAFNAELVEFASVDRSLGTLMFGLIGDSVDYRDISAANRVLAPLLTFLFTFVVSILFFSLFITMIDEAYTIVKEEMHNKKEEHQDMLLGRARLLRKQFVRKTQKAADAACPCRFAMYKLGFRCAMCWKKCCCKYCCCLLFKVEEDASGRMKIKAPRRGSVLGSWIQGKSVNKTRGKGVWVKNWMDQRREQEKELEERRKRPRPRRPRRKKSTLKAESAKSFLLAGADHAAVDVHGNERAQTERERAKHIGASQISHQASKYLVTAAHRAHEHNTAPPSTSPNESKWESAESEEKELVEYDYNEPDATSGLMLVEDRRLAAKVKQIMEHFEDEERKQDRVTQQYLRELITLVKGGAVQGQPPPPQRLPQRQQEPTTVRVARPARSAKKQPQSSTQAEYKTLWNQQGSSSPTASVPELDAARPASREELDLAMDRSRRKQQQQQEEDFEDYEEGEITLTSYCRGFGEESEGTTGF